MAVLSLPVVLLKSAELPLAVLSLPVVLLFRANAPTATLKLPLSLKTIASVPTAVFWVPVVLSKSAAAPTAVFESALFNVNAPPPTAVLKLPVLLLKSAYQPTPEFPEPVVRRLSALHPSAMVKLEHPSGGGLTASTFCSDPKQAIRTTMRNWGITVFMDAILLLLCSTRQCQNDRRSRQRAGRLGERFPLVFDEKIRVRHTGSEQRTERPPRGRGCYGLPNPKKRA